DPRHLPARLPWLADLQGPGPPAGGPLPREHRHRPLAIAAHRRVRDAARAACRTPPALSALAIPRRHARRRASVVRRAADGVRDGGGLVRRGGHRVPSLAAPSIDAVHLLRVLTGI